MKEKIILSHLTPSDVIHPQERSALISVIKKIPGGESALKGIGELYGKWVAVEYIGNGVVATEKSMPELHKLLREVCTTVSLSSMPELATEWAYLISSYTVGGSKLRVVLSSGAIDLLSKEELSFLIGQEIGHIISGHLPYHMLLELLYTPALKDPTLSLIAGVVKMPLLDWYRKSHYTADRVSLLCCQDINIALRTMMKMAGLPKKYYQTTDPNAFLRQAREFTDLSTDGWASNMMTGYLLRSASLPWMVDRAKVLMEWYESGAYQSILDRG
ncbi:MAG: M48 family metallopeptidase [Bacteroidaceae bacterium]|nr:M48 family metallopeptidase [Bacteroidaceae bacterium]